MFFTTKAKGRHLARGSDQGQGQSSNTDSACLHEEYSSGLSLFYASCPTMFRFVFSAPLLLTSDCKTYFIRTQWECKHWCLNHQTAQSLLHTHPQSSGFMTCGQLYLTGKTFCSQCFLCLCFSPWNKNQSSSIIHQASTWIIIIPYSRQRYFITVMEPCHRHWRLTEFLHVFLWVQNKAPDWCLTSPGECVWFEIRSYTRSWSTVKHVVFISCTLIRLNETHWHTLLHHVSCIYTITSACTCSNV